MFNPRAWAEVRLDCLQRNLQQVRAAVGPLVEVMAVIKADAYGHGAVPVARAALDAGASRLGVGDSTEAIELRESGIAAPVHVLGALVEREMDEVVYHGITPTIHSLARVQDLDRRAAAQGRRLPVHLMVDTGMGRLGVRPESAEELLLAIAARPHLRLEGIATHLSSAGDPDPSFTDEQLASFRRVLRRARALGVHVPRVHAAATAGLFLHGAKARFNLVRPGISLYGIDPDGLARRAGVRLEPVLSLRSQVVFLKHVEAGTPVGYGAAWRAPERTAIATVPIGYDDGYPYNCSKKGAEVLVRGVRCPVVGTVTMDYLIVDVGRVPEPKVGDTVTLIGRDGGEEVRVEDVARWAGTIPYAIPCGLGKRVRRVYLSTPAERERDRAPEADALPYVLGEDTAPAA
jgi:alanine racemase